MNKTKRCSKCGETLLVSEFSKNKTRKDGLNHSCKGCCKAYREENREKILEYKKAYREENREKIRESKKAHREKNREKILERDKAYREENRGKIQEYKKAYREENREKIRESGKAYREENRKRIQEYKKAYREKNREKILERDKAYQKNRLSTDPHYRMRRAIRNVTCRAYRRRGWKKNSATQKILGCSFGEFKKHIESQFKEGMTWDNHGEWHYDHRIPLASAKTEERITELSHYTNLQPLWASENKAKGDAMPEDWEKMKPEWEEARKHKPNQ